MGNLEDPHELHPAELRMCGDSPKTIPLGQLRTVGPSIHLFYDLGFDAARGVYSERVRR